MQSYADALIQHRQRELEKIRTSDDGSFDLFWVGSPFIIG